MEARIDHHNPLPLYVQIKNLLREKILDGEFSPGSQLPTEQELCDSYHISRITAKRALDDLAATGVIQRIQGKGTFVAERLVFSDEVMGFSKMVRRYGLTPGARIISIRSIETNENLRVVFGLPPEDKHEFASIKRLLSIDERPAALITSIFPHWIGNRIIEHDLENQSLYDLIKKELGQPVLWSEAILTPVIPSLADSQVLKVSSGSAHFHNRQMSYIRENIPVELSIGIFSADIFQWGSRIVSPGFEMRKDASRIDNIVA